jgi:LCP family protein required for cell wall assembly
LPDLAQKRGLWKRYVIGAVLILAAAAAATSVTAFNEVDKITKAFGGNLPGVQGELADAAAGKPQTILLIGSDKRAKGARDANSGARSDTMILVRLDPGKRATALLSLPRDLKVQIPGHGVDKLNASYSIGGPKLTLQTIKQFTGLRVNHVINVDFRGFKDAVNAIGCVYADVDRRYFNDNANPGDQYATINIQPGYQKLCGQDALDYVRYRHTDTDIVRAARQQDFLRQAKAQVGVGKLFNDQDKLVKIVSKYTRSDIKGRKAVLRLLKLAIASAGHPIQEIHFPAHVGASYVTASQSAVQKVAKQFLGVQGTKGPRGEAQPKKPGHKRSGGSSQMIDISAGGKQQALNVVKGGARGLKIYYPRLGVPGSTYSTASPRSYQICGPHHRCWTSYRIVLARDLLGEYYGLQGTTWQDPPILKDPTQKKKIGGKQFEIFYDGDRIRLVAWRERDAVYWVSNTLLQTISRKQMLAIAKSARALS